MLNKEEVTCREISNKNLKYIVLKSTRNLKQYFETTLSALPWWSHCVPKKLRKKLFIVAAIDHVDHDPSFATAKFYFMEQLRQCTKGINNFTT